MGTELSDLKEELRELTERVARLEWQRDDPLRSRVAQLMEERISSLEADRKRVWLAGWGVAFFVLAIGFDALKQLLPL